tara:strand:- start:7431 stop:8108 length:678 start_codon:yes stop_codon:yes gene_type:complete
METILKHAAFIKEVIRESRNAYTIGQPYCYVYAHKIAGEIFYIGKGSHDRVIRIAGRSKKWYETAFGKDIEVTILTGLINEVEALEQENNLISLHKNLINKLFSKQPSVLCFNRTGVIHKHYNKLNDVQQNGFKPDCVRKCCNGERGIHKNYVWMYTSEFQRVGFQHKVASNHSKNIVQKTKDGIFIRELLTAEAFVEFGFNPKNIQQVCTGAKKSHKDYVFAYK